MQTNFLSIVQMFQMQAMMSMGKLMNPVTGVIEKSLEHARFCIDVLNVLEEKTKNNLTPEEQRLLANVLQDLRINFVAEKGKNDETPAQEQMDKPEEKETAPPSEETA